MYRFSPYHVSINAGNDGPLHVSDPRQRNPITSAFVEACVESGLGAVFVLLYFCTSKASKHQITSACVEACVESGLYPHLTCFTSTKVQILTQKALPEDNADYNGATQEGCSRMQVF